MLKIIKNILNKTYLVHFYGKHLQVKTYKKKYKSYLKDLLLFRQSGQISKSRFDLEKILLYPELEDNVAQTPIEPHYTYHPAWAARILANTTPEKHVDISSTMAFCTLVSAFLPVEFYDYRPADLKLSGLTSSFADLMNLPFDDNSVLSLSCMHTLEHIGLGRYGDAIDYDGDIKAINELKRVLALNGDLLIVTPVGKPKIEFNAHRIYSYDQIVDYFSPLKLIEFSLVPDHFENVGIIKDATREMSNEQSWGCGCFWFKK
jgi:SAM-dependent methyltransferase